MRRRFGPNEAETCRDVVLPMLESAGWSVEQVLGEYVLKADRVVTPGGAARDLPDGRADYVLAAVGGVPCSVIEAKREYRAAAEGLQQAIRYGQQLDVPVVYATNGREILEHSLRTGEERYVESVATPPELWSEWLSAQGIDAASGELLAQPFNRRRTSVQGDVIEPRWYQRKAVHRVLRAIARGERRILLLMATGTGKTFTAMQIVAKLHSYQRAVRPDRNYRVLYLADLDVLLSQPMDKDFTAAFGREPLHRVKGGANTSREIYFASYQAMTGSGAGDVEALFHDYPADFFDLIVIDECHRGSAAENSTWRRVLDHFATAVQLGLTATPKLDATVDTTGYFGDPVFEYSLRQGIEDGFLAPYRVRRVVLSPDADGWEPSQGERDRFGREIPDGVYTTRDFERTLSLVMRTELAARHLSRLLRVDPTARAMIFCVDQQHAEDMRAALAVANQDLVADDPSWVVRIVGAEPDRVRLLEEFTNPESETPVVATTSRMLSTGVDVQDLKFVVLFRPIGSMVEFKQIVGRGTRLYPEKGKTHFEIVDYVGASALFEDPEFDGWPRAVRVETVDADGRVTERVDQTAVESEVWADDHGLSVGEPVPAFHVHDPLDAQFGGGEDRIGADHPPAPGKLFVDEGAFRVVAETILVPDTSTGRLTLSTYGEFVGGAVRSIASSAGDLAAKWAHAPSRADVLAELRRHDVALGDLVGSEVVDACDPLDVLTQLAWNTPLRTRAERARRVREQHAVEIAELSATAQQVLSALIDRYSTYGVDEITDENVLRVEPLRSIGNPVQIARAFGGAAEWKAHRDRLQEWLYSA